MTEFFCVGMTSQLEGAKKRMHHRATKAQAPLAWKIALTAFPDYKGRSLVLRPFHPMAVTSYWDGGSRDYYAFVHLGTGRKADIPQNGTGYDRVRYPQLDALPEQIVLVQHTYFCGKDLGLTLYVQPEHSLTLLLGNSAVS